jgi:hypothetical protein
MTAVLIALLFVVGGGSWAPPGPGRTVASSPIDKARWRPVPAHPFLCSHHMPPIAEKGDGRGQQTSRSDPVPHFLSYFLPRRKCPACRSDWPRPTHTFPPKIASLAEWICAGRDHLLPAIDLLYKLRIATICQAR